MSKDSTKDWAKVREDAATAAEVDIEAAPHEALDYPDHEELEKKLTQAEQQVHQHWEELVRAKAELENQRRRSEQEVLKAHRYGLDKMATALLPVGDSLEQAMQLVDQASDNAMYEGLSLTMKLFLDTLEKFNIKPIDPTGERFNPEQHEAMTAQPSSDVAPNTVLMVLQKGYTLNDRVIRPARVIVSK